MADIDQHRLTNPHESLVTAREAAEILGVKLATLYAYVSRGLLGSTPADEGRSRLYARSEVEALRARRNARTRGGPTAGAALRWGDPVLDSSITEMTPHGPVYRGRPALALVERDVAFESVAELLWTGPLPARRAAWPRGPSATSLASLAGLVPEGATPLSAISLFLAATAARDHGRYDTRPETVLARARALVPGMAASLALVLAPRRIAAALRARSVAETVVLAAGRRPDASSLRDVNRALVLCADHELNVSAFAARVVASAKADLYACLQAALAALSGPLHGGFLERIEAVAAEIDRPERAARVVYERTRRGDGVPGFFHPLYPDGDPRARPLLDAARRLGARSPRVQALLALVDAMREAGLGAPTIDVGLAALGAALGLPPGSAVGIFAVGRSAGWIAHVIEQYEARFLIRPRARYVTRARRAR